MRLYLRKSVLLQQIFLECGTVSQILDIEENRIRSSHQLQILCHSVSSVFYSAVSKVEVIEVTRTKLLLAMYRSKVHMLNKLRYKMFMEKKWGYKIV